jgi:hypothetical protein
VDFCNQQQEPAKIGSASVNLALKNGMSRCCPLGEEEGKRGDFKETVARGAYNQDRSFAANWGRSSFAAVNDKSLCRRTARSARQDYLQIITAAD